MHWYVWKIKVALASKLACQQVSFLLINPIANIWDVEGIRCISVFLREYKVFKMNLVSTAVVLIYIVHNIA